MTQLPENNEIDERGDRGRHRAKRDVRKNVKPLN